ncbi:hypothetical protein MKW98_028701 [Papaver atlanticum]|uniref:Uncharacterized protein n=1 Tax=Papaver atlanticum TaxID=357466 RepID=A0AAD4S3D1_9MAGN|nr:hypothetical protein MKW98_028701 [Papaver atlanticum]
MIRNQPLPSVFFCILMNQFVHESTDFSSYAGIIKDCTYQNIKWSSKSIVESDTLFFLQNLVYCSQSRRLLLTVLGFVNFLEFIRHSLDSGNNK